MLIKNFQMSDWFWFDEMVQTSHLEYLAQNINEAPEFLFNATLFAREILDPMRGYFGPMTPGSWFRCPPLNSFVKGSRTSQHMRGTAVDYSRGGWGWQQVFYHGNELAKIFKKGGVNAKVIMELLDTTYWLHVGRDKEPTLWTGINGIYEKHNIL